MAGTSSEWPAGEWARAKTLNHLRAIGRSLHVWVVPTQVSIGAADRAFGPRGEPVDPEVRDRLMSVGKASSPTFAWLHKCENPSPVS